MPVDAIVIDVAITWLGAAGCGLFLWHLSMREDRAELKAVRLLVAVLTVLLFVRGFGWWLPYAWLDRVVLTVASVLPLAITLFCERLLRRHHPRWLKLLALTTSLVFVLLNAFIELADSSMLVSFMALFALVVAANGGYLLAARPAQLGAEEIRLARALVVVALLSVPLLLTDFRTLHQQVPVRMGAIAALLFVYVMLSAAAGRSVARLPLRLLGWLATAIALAALFSLVGGGIDALRGERFLRSVPVAYAWLLLMAVFGLSRSAAASARDHDFMRWLGTAPMATVDDFVAALATYPSTQGCLALGADDLAGYDLDRLWQGVPDPDEPVALAWARAHRSDAGGEHTAMASAEQWLDLLERWQMTHALPVSRTRPLVVLLNLPVAAAGSLPQLRARLLLRIARRLVSSEP